MRKLPVLLVGPLFVLAMIACGGESDAQSDAAGTSDGAGASTELATDDERTLYTIGLMLSQNLTQLGLEGSELGSVIAGLRDGVTGADPKVDMQEWGPKVQQFAQARATAKAELEKAAAAAFVEEQAAMAGAQRTDSGLVYIEMTPGTGASPSATDKVKVHYHGTLRDGTVFDSSVDRGAPIDFGLNQVIACWTEGVQMMKVGGKSKLVCPSDIAYGDGGRPPTIPGGATLVFEVELLEVLPAE